MAEWQQVKFQRQSEPHLFFSIPLGIAFICLLIASTIPQQVPMVTEHNEWLPIQQQRADNNNQKHSIQLHSGDTAIPILRRFGFSMRECVNMLAIAENVYPLRRVRAGHHFTLYKNNNSKHIYYDIDNKQRLHLVRSLQSIENQETNQSWQASLEDRPTISRTVQAQGIVKSNLFLDAARAGLDDGVTIELVDLFAWDIDFVRNLRKGDRFRVIYNEHFGEHGKRLRVEIVAAEFINRGKTFNAFHFNDEYYDVAGKNIRKDFLKAPLKFSRISSRFNPHRKHPILGYTRAHNGTDYAAPSGTPIHAVGSGKIIFKGRAGGYGRLIRIAHDNGINSTYYAHMSRYANNLHKGSKVRQGQVIGYVGQSGRATGPHLHFEFRKNGKPINPQLVKSSPTTPLASKDMPRFEQAKLSLATRMARMTSPQPWS
ncbi:MAG: peptidoglycan DD-metalloendopeptidase family protein [Mariprofundales bacterium]